MACEQVTLNDGSIILVNVKPGQTLTEEDIEMLNEFHELLKIQKEQEGPSTRGRRPKA